MLALLKRTLGRIAQGFKTRINAVGVITDGDYTKGGFTQFPNPGAYPVEGEHVIPKALKHLLPSQAIVGRIQRDIDHGGAHSDWLLSLSAHERYKLYDRQIERATNTFYERVETIFEQNHWVQVPELRINGDVVWASVKGEVQFVRQNQNPVTVDGKLFKELLRHLAATQSDTLTDNTITTL